ncbi:MAG: hypothetical protein AB8G18_13435 [Gammaproteobacteria bacterium]
MAGKRSNLLAVGLVAMLCACAQGGEESTTPDTTSSNQALNGAAPMPSDKAFLNVVLNQNEQTECSPSEEGPEWRGIKINAPSSVHLKVGDDQVENVVQFGSTPVCGYSLIDMLEAREAGPMRIVAIDEESGQEFSGELNFDAVDDDPPADDPFGDEPDEDTDEDLEGMATGGFFNANLHSFVELPSKPARYNVNVVQGSNRSNSVVIEVKD